MLYIQLAWNDIKKALLRFMPKGSLFQLVSDYLTTPQMSELILPFDELFRKRERAAAARGTRNSS